MKHLSPIPGLLLFLGSVLGSPGAVPPPDKLLPADTLGMLTVPDYKKGSGVWNEWPSRKLWSDPAMKPFRDKLAGKLKSELAAPLEKELGVKFAEFANLAQGQITLAVTANGWDGISAGVPGFLFLMDVRDQGSLLKSNLTTLKNRWVDSGKQVRVDKIRDVEFTTLIIKPEELKKSLNKAFPSPNPDGDDLETPKPGRADRGLELLVGQSDSLLVVASSAKDVEKVLVNQTGGVAASLAEQAAFASSYSGQFRDALAYGWVNTKLIVDSAINAAGKQADGAKGRGQGGLRPEKLLASVGLSGLQSLAFNVRDVGDGCMMNFNLNVPDSSRRGLFKLLSYEAKDANPPPFVPADVIKFTRWRLDLQKAWATIESTLTEAIPQIAGFVKLVVDNAGKDKDPNFDLRKNLIANLGDDLITYQKTPRKQTLMELGSPPTLFLVGSARAEQVASAVKALGAVMPQPKVKEREFLGRQVYALNLGSAPGPDGKQVDRVLHYTASGGYVALSTDVGLLEEFMRSGDSAPKALRDMPGLSAAAQKVGGMGTGLFGFENQLEGTRQLVETLRKESGTLANLFSASPFAGRLGMSDDAAKFKDWVDFSLLPPFDQIAKYFYITVWTGSVTPEGLGFKVYAPNPH